MLKTQTYICISYHCPTLRWPRQLKYFFVEGIGLFIVISQRQGCLWPGDTKSQSQPTNQQPWYWSGCPGMFLLLVSEGLPIIASSPQHYILLLTPLRFRWGYHRQGLSMDTQFQPIVLCWVQHGLILILAWICNHIHSKVGMKLLIHYQTSTVVPLKFENGLVISSQTV